MHLMSNGKSIAIAQINVHVGNFEKNTQKIIDNILRAKEQGIKLIVFPELAVCGYPPRDFLEFDFFIDSCENAIDTLANYAFDIEVIVGSPSRNKSKKGKRLFNSAFHLKEGKVSNVFHKTLLPNYDVFDEYRYFEPNSTFSNFTIDGHCYGVAICEDLWNVEHNPLYTISPAEELKKLGVQTIINIAASPFSYVQDQKRKSTLKINAIQQDLSIVYCNHVGSQTELIFDGGSFFMDQKGEVTNQANLFSEDFIVGTQKDKNPLASHAKMELIHDALILGIKDYFRKSNFTKAVLGLSGGIDSAVTFALASEALGADNVLAVLMPSEFSSDHSIKDAEDLVLNLNANKIVIPIKATYSAFQDELSELFFDQKFDVTEENLQARIRGTLLMAVSNKFGNIVLNTSNKSEAAVGYGTLYGDMNGGLSVLGDVYKTEVFELAKYINRNEEVIPTNTIVKPPSAELRPDQKDSDSLPDYEILDAILFNYIEKRKGEKELVELGYEKDLVRKVLSLVNLTEYKRYQTPPTLRISPKSFGMGRRMPIVAKY
jgi:NAD+ synthase (glutamine-hydrolysing)